MSRVCEDHFSRLSCPTHSPASAQACRRRRAVCHITRDSTASKVGDSVGVRGASRTRGTAPDTLVAFRPRLQHELEAACVGCADVDARCAATRHLAARFSVSACAACVKRWKCQEPADPPLLCAARARARGRGGHNHTAPTSPLAPSVRRVPFLPTDWAIDSSIGVVALV